MEQMKTDKDKDRLESMKNINGLLKDISGIFTKMSTIVHMHEGMIERIDSEVEGTETNIKQGKKEIKKMYQDVSSNRKLILKVFAILIIFSIIYVLFIS